MTSIPLSERLRLAGFELMLQQAPPWLYSAPYDAASLIERLLRADAIEPELLLSIIGVIETRLQCPDCGRDYSP